MVRTPTGAICVGLLTLVCLQACAAKSRVNRDLFANRSFGATVESHDQALSDALIGLTLAPSAERHRAVAAEYRRLHIDDLAFDHLTAATRLDPSDAAAYDARARIWRDWGFAHLGVGDATRAVYHAPDSAEAHNTRGTLLAVLGQTDAARQEFERAVQLDQGATFAKTNLCLLDAQKTNASSDARECGLRRDR